MCNLDCFNCPYPDCVRPLNADNLKYIKRWQEKNPDKVKQYQKNKRARYSEEKKAEELQRLLDWKSKNPTRVRKSQLKSNRRWRERNRERERERNRLNYLKRKEAVSSGTDNNI